MAKLCEHCRRREVSWKTKPATCMYCVNTGHRGATIADCPKCAPPPEPHDDGERNANSITRNFKIAA